MALKNMLEQMLGIAASLTTCDTHIPLRVPGSAPAPLSANTHSGAAGHGPRPWTPATQTGDLDGAPSPWLCLGSALAAEGIWGMN